MTLRTTLLAAVALVLLVGCARGQRYVRHEDVATAIATRAEGAVFSASITPICEFGRCYAFALRIENHTARTLDVDWARTQFLVNGQTRRGFILEGEFLMDKNAPPPPSIVLPKGRLSATLLPSVTTTHTARGWSRESLPQGEAGVFLTVVDGDCRLTTTLLVRMSEEKKTRGGKADAQDGEKKFRHEPASIVEDRCTSSASDVAPPATLPPDDGAASPDVVAPPSSTAAPVDEGER